MEIFGLLQLATNLPGLDRHTDTETYRTFRPDGTVRDLAVPRVAPHVTAPGLANGNTATEHDPAPSAAVPEESR